MDRVGLMMGLAEALNERAASWTLAGSQVIAANRRALGLTPSGYLRGVDRVSYYGDWVVVEEDECHCVGGGPEVGGAHERHCGMEPVGYVTDVPLCVLVEAQVGAQAMARRVVA